MKIEFFKSLNQKGKMAQDNLIFYNSIELFFL